VLLLLLAAVAWP